MTSTPRVTPALIVVASLLALVFGQGRLAAQDLPPSEVGFVFGVTAFPSFTKAGVGARFLHNYNERFGFEYQGAFYPLDKTTNYYQNSFNFKHTYRMEARNKFNLFALLGPGFLVQDSSVVATKTRFSINVGGGVEFIPHPSLGVRLDFTDYIFFAKGEHPSNFDFKLGLMYRW